MKRPIIIAILVVAVAAAGIFLYNYFSPASPAGHAALTANDLEIAVDYSRPFVKERVIFGERDQGALQPYGEYWRLGANAATEISFSRDVRFNGERVEAGTYRMYAVPGAENFEIALNDELGVSGSQEPDAARDVLRISVPVERLAPPREQFTIIMEETGRGIDVIFEWSDVRFVVPVSVAN